MCGNVDVSDHEWPSRFASETGNALVGNAVPVEPQLLRSGGILDTSGIASVAKASWLCCLGAHFEGCTLRPALGLPPVGRSALGA